MSDSEIFVVNGMWPCRLEAPSALARRVIDFLSFSRSSQDPVRTWWFHLDDGKPVNPLQDPAGFERLIEHSVSADDFTERPIWGYSMSAFLAEPDGQDHPHMPHFSLCVGSAFSNWVRIVSCLEASSSPCVPTYESMRSNVLAVAKAFAPDWCQGGPSSLTRYTDFELYARPPMTLDWMIYLCPSSAAMVSPPDPSWHVTIEQFGDGSMFMSATEDMFDLDNPVHIGAARAIQRRIDPLNFSVPFNGRSGRNPRG